MQFIFGISHKFSNNVNLLTSGGAKVALAPRSRCGRYHKSPNDTTLQLCTPKWDLEQFFHPPLQAANYINANISGVLSCLYVLSCAVGIWTKNETTAMNPVWFFYSFF